MPRSTPRPVTISGSDVYVHLTQGYTAVVDAADLPLVQSHSWMADVKRRRDGSVRTVYAYRKTKGSKSRKTVYLHRELLAPAADVTVDHRDGDGLNNRRLNLRLATQAQNVCNRRISLANSSGVKGVSWHSRKSKWRAAIVAEDRHHHLGYFDTVEAAAAAYARASIKLHGEYGRTAHA